MVSTVKKYSIYHNSGDFISTKAPSNQPFFTVTEGDFTGVTREVQGEFGKPHKEHQVILQGFWLKVGYRWTVRKVPYLFFFSKLERAEEPYHEYVSGSKAVWVRKDHLPTLSTPSVKDL